LEKELRKMSGQEAVEQELRRLRAELDRAPTVDPVDVAVVEALASSEVQEQLVPLLDEGARLFGVVLESAGAMEGVVQLTFDCDWAPGTSHLTDPPAVSALVEISPPRVLRVSRIAAPPAGPGVRFAPPEGPIPPALRELSFPTASEALEFSSEADRNFEGWLARTGLSQMLRPGLGLTTGTKCTSLFCFERTSDDFDLPRPRPKVFTE
jgi:hypothetical protein